MNGWLAGALVLLIAEVPCFLVTFRGRAVDRLVGLQAAGVLSTLAVLALSVGQQRSIYATVAIVFAVLNVVATIAIARVLERWL
jgi:multisubunit Na+/H+ antiporter MnhF subunit